MLTATIKQNFFRDELAGIVSFRASRKLKLVSCYSSKMLVWPSQVSAFPSPSPLLLNCCVSSPFARRRKIFPCPKTEQEFDPSHKISRSEFQRT